jgi:transcriptional regulator with XRE-family HTH domain
MTLTGLAAAAGVPQPNMSKIEAGDEQPSWQRLCAIATALGVGPAVLVGPTESPTEATWPFARGRKRKVAA